MGTQIRFYALPQDEIYLLDRILLINQIAFIKLICATNTPEFITKEELLSDPKNNSEILIWEKTEHIPDVAFRRIPNRKSYYVSTYDAPCMEYSRCIINDTGILTQGRIWAEYSYWYKNTLIRKSEEFISAYKSISYWIKHNLWLHGKGSS
jgi:hypothetical protein